MASAGFEPTNLGTKGQHATPRPPKPLMQDTGSLFYLATVVFYFLLLLCCSSPFCTFPWYNDTPLNQHLIIQHLRKVIFSTYCQKEALFLKQANLRDMFQKAFYQSACTQTGVVLCIHFIINISVNTTMQ